jgi:hypothetical protein
MSLLAALALTAASAPALAQSPPLAVLTGDSEITLVAAQTPAAGRKVAVSGLSAPLVGIDVRPADRMLYGLARDGVLFTIDLAAGTATRKAQLDKPMPAAGPVTVDFNPVADRLRVIGADGTNLRINVDTGQTIVDGALKFAENDTNKGKSPRVIGGAYINSVAGAKETTLYDIEAGTGSYTRQAPPNDGVLVTIAPLKAPAAVAAFDIETDASGANRGWVIAGDALHSLDPATGALTMAGRITGLGSTVRDLAVLPR